MVGTTSTVRRRFAAGALALGSALTAFGLLAPSASAGLVEPTTYTGNPGCGEGDHELKIDDIPEVPAGGTYDVDTPNVKTKGVIPEGLYIELSNVVLDDEGPDKSVTFDWAAFLDADPDPVPFAISYVLVKFADGGLRYDYDPAATADTGLHSTKDSISHLTFCFAGGSTDDGDDTDGGTGYPTGDTDDPTTGGTDDVSDADGDTGYPTTGSTDDTTTTTTGGTTTGGTDDPTTTTGETTTGGTDDPTTTTGDTDDVAGTTGGTDDPTTTTGDDTQVGGIQIPRPQTEVLGRTTLPATGAKDHSLILLGGALILAGCVSLVMSREVLARS